MLLFHFNFLGFYSYLPLVYPALQGLEQLLKCRLGVWVAPTTKFTSELPFPSTNYSSKDI